MAQLAIQQIDLDGEAEDFAAVGASDQFANNGKTFLHFKNTNAATRTVTINSQRACDQGFDHDVAVVIPATTGSIKIGPFPKFRFNDASGNVLITYSATTNLTVACYSI